MSFKTFVFSLTLLFIGVCAFRTPLEARTHFSLNIGALLAPRPAHGCCVVERYPVFAEPVYVVPAPRVVFAPPPPPHHFHEVRIYPAPCPFCY